ncbi:hypothetical protein CLOP_g6765, partial [Closterium sp. NIES-67]
STP